MEKALSLYLHIPFCVRKCAYCDFLSFPADDAVKERYTEKLAEELRLSAASYRDYHVRSIFYGGGTPSVLKEEALPFLMDVVRECYDLYDDAEISAEANPGTVTEAKLRLWKQAGINRLSLGCQSLKDEELALLGRIHRAEDLYQSFEAARSAGFDNINVDLMSALPGQDCASYLSSLSGVLKLRPEHISAYSLIIEEETPFYERYNKADEKRRRGEAQSLLPDEEEERAMLYEGRRLLREAGYHQYELSNYALEGRECRHNRVYWERGDYAGFGLGAASCVGERRWKNTSDLEEYLSFKEVTGLRREEQKLTEDEARSEAL
ncbi:MAG: radical SAM family heme chaperone HemW, partial [Lachnospiraceae bacterium]|nr:radical SAM family heme chaperone HemW [Lachnospiraceae bacterium]